MNVVVEMIFGSHLYGTATENSDMDYKGVFLPSKRDLFLNRVSKSVNRNTKTDNNGKNTANDIDSEFYSLHYFIELACQGQTAAMDMLFAPDDKLVRNSDIWLKIIENRHRFLTKNLQAFIGYARRQASKYGVKGSRLSDAKAVIDFVNSEPDRLHSVKLKDYWDELPTGEHIYKLNSSESNVKFYQVCGRKISDTCSLQQLHDIVRLFYESYGARAKQAELNSGIDWKAVSHALRAAYQIKQILTEGLVTFPLKEAPFLIKVKNGELNFINEVSPLLDELMDEVERLSEISKLPDKVDVNFWDDFIYDVINQAYVI